ncbi:MAG: recombinase family protein [Candidatus Hermodarchaeota archaeon]
MTPGPAFVKFVDAEERASPASLIPPNLERFIPAKVNPKLANIDEYLLELIYQIATRTNSLYIINQDSNLNRRKDVNFLPDLFRTVSNISPWCTSCFNLAVTLNPFKIKDITEIQDILSKIFLLAKWQKNRLQRDIFLFLSDIASGATTERPNLTQLLECLERHPGEYGFLCTKLNRLARLSVPATLELVFKLRHLTNDQVVFIDEPLINFQQEENVGHTYLVLKSLLSAEWREEHRQNVKRGIARVRAEGKSWGRKKKELNVKQYQRLKAAGASLTMIAKILGMSKPTLLKRLKEAGLYEPNPSPFTPSKKKQSNTLEDVHD